MGVRAFILLSITLVSMNSSLMARKYASIVVDADTGMIHHQANPDVITFPASLTKMMTLYLTFKALTEGRITLHQKLKVSKKASRQVPCKLWLKPGSTITVQQAIFALVTKSANDAAVALAEGLEGAEEKFAQKMTQQAKKLGMNRTVFKNASGLPNSKQVTTARDMATLSMALYRDYPEYFSYFKKQTFTYKGTKHKNHNHLLGKVKGVDGIKTGFINASGFNLAASVVRNNKRIIAVVLGGKTWRSRDKHMIELLEGTYKKLKKFGNQTYMSMNQLIHNITPSRGKVHKHSKSKPPVPPTKMASLTHKPSRIFAENFSAPVRRIPSKIMHGGPKIHSIEDLIVSVDEHQVRDKNSFSRPLSLHPVSETMIDI